jgi:hypothetical protein
MGSKSRKAVNAPVAKDRGPTFNAPPANWLISLALRGVVSDGIFKSHLMMSVNLDNRQRSIDQKSNALEDIKS